MVHKHFNVIINSFFLFFFLSSLNPNIFYPFNQQDELNDSTLPDKVKFDSFLEDIALEDQETLLKEFFESNAVEHEISKKGKNHKDNSVIDEFSSNRDFLKDFRPKLQDGGGDMYTVTLNKTGRDVFVKDGFAYVADSESGIAIINVTDPTNPGTPNYHFLKLGLDVAEDIFVKDGFAYVAYATEGLAVFNVSDPLNPGTPVYKALPGNEYAEAVFVEGNYSYVVGGEVYIFDVSNPLNPGNPVMISTGGNPHGIYVRDNLAYISAENNGLAIINVTNPFSPTTISEEFITNCWCEDIYLKGNYAYLASGSDGLAVIDISNPLNPGPPAYMSVSGSSKAITVFGDYAFMAGASTSLGLSMFNIEDPTNPIGPIYKFTGGSIIAHGVFVDGDYAYVTEGSVAIGSRLLIIEWAPILLSPSNNSTISDSTPDLDWKDVTDASYYHVQVADSGDFSNITSETNISSSSWPISPPLSSGVYYWRVRANDSLDKWGAWSPARQFEVDIDLPPNINLLTPSNNTIQPYSSKIQLDITDSNLDTVFYNWDNGTNQTLSSPWQINLTLSEGWHNLHIYANDTNGFTSSKIFRFYCDPTPPIILLQTPLNNTIHQSGTVIDIDIIDNNSVSVFYHWDASTNQSWVDPYLTSLPVGETNHVLHVYVNDTAGNSNYNQYIFTTDDTIPLIALISPINDTFIPSSIIIDLDISDTSPFSHVLYAWGLDPWTPLNSPYDVPLPGSDGIYALHIYANDTADNWDYKYFLFGIDGTLPVITLESSVNDTTSNSGLIIDVNVSDTYLDFVLFNWDGNSNQTWLSPFQTLIPSSEGVHWLHIYANDFAGNLNYEKYLFITDDTIPIISLDSPEEYSVLDPNTLIDIFINDLNLNTVLYAWDDESFQFWNSPYQTNLPSEEGFHELFVYANDSAGNYDYLKFKFYSNPSNIQDPITAVQPSEFIFNSTIPINVVFLGFDESQLDLNQIDSSLTHWYAPTTFRPLGLTIGSNYSLDFNYYLSNQTNLEFDFINYLSSIATIISPPADLLDYDPSAIGAYLFNATDTINWLNNNINNYFGFINNSYCLYIIDTYTWGYISDYYYYNLDKYDPDTGVESSENLTIMYGGDYPNRGVFLDLSAGPVRYKETLTSEANEGVSSVTIPPIWEYVFPQDKIKLNTNLTEYIQETVDLVFTPSYLYRPSASNIYNLTVYILDNTSTSYVYNNPLDYINPSDITTALKSLTPYSEWNASYYVDILSNYPELQQIITNAYEATDHDTYPSSINPYQTIIDYLDENRSVFSIDDNTIPVFIFAWDEYLFFKNIGILGFAEADENGDPLMVMIGYNPQNYPEYGYTFTVIHEVGHILGLNHPHNGFSWDKFSDSGNYLVVDWLYDFISTPMTYAYQDITFTTFDFDSLDRGYTFDRLNSSRYSLYFGNNSLLSKGYTGIDIYLDEYLGGVAINRSFAIEAFNNLDFNLAFYYANLSYVSALEYLNYVNSLPIFIPTLDLPSNDTFISYNNPILDWNSISNAVEYRIHLADNSLFNFPLLDQITGSPNYITSSLVDGNYFWRVQAKDASGNWGLWSSTYNFTVDTQYPGISLINPINNTVHLSGVNVELSITDIYLDEVLYHWDTDFNQTWSAPYNTILPSVDGQHILHVYANDSAGNIIYYKVVFLTDDSLPVINLDVLVNNTVRKSGVIVDIDVTSPSLDTVLYNWDQTTNQSWNSPYLVGIPAGDGPHILYVYAINSLGNGNSKIFIFITDDTPPAIQVVPTSGSIIEIGKTVDIVIFEINGPSVQYSWDNIQNITLNLPYTIQVPPTLGEHILRIYCTDLAGHLTYQTFSFTITPEISSSSSSQSSQSTPTSSTSQTPSDTVSSSKTDTTSTNTVIPQTSTGFEIAIFSMGLIVMIILNRKKFDKNN